MGFRLRHEFVEGAALPDGRGGIGAQLSVCEECETLRVSEASGVTFIRRKEEEAERVSSKEPPCISSGAPFRAPW
jgi:hypothetical protein